MRRRHLAASVAGPSLVPLADMLSNTVGVMVFIFIFAVMAAGGAAVSKTFPIERPSHLRYVLLVCQGERVFALDSDTALGAFLAPLGRPSLETVDAWLASFKGHRLEADSFVLTGEGRLERRDLGFQQFVSLEIAVTAVPRTGHGGSSADLRRPGTELRTFLDRHPPSRRFVYFLVYPDALRSFMAARDVVRAAGYRTGWNPRAAGETLSFGFGRGDGGVIPIPVD